MVGPVLRRHYVTVVLQHQGVSPTISIVGKSKKSKARAKNKSKAKNKRPTQSGAPPIAKIFPPGKKTWDADEQGAGSSVLLAKKLAKKLPEKLPEKETTTEGHSEPAPGPIGLAAMVLRLDQSLAKIELAFVSIFVVALVLIGVYQFAITTVLKGRVDWADEMIRFLVFFTAMSAAALAAQQRRMMAIDFVPRLLSAKKRTIVRILLALFVVFICALLVWAGWLNRESQLLTEQSSDHIISIPDAMLAFPLGIGLIGVHFLFQAIIDGSFLLRRLTPPEPEMSA